MTRIEIIELVKKSALEYAKDGIVESVKRNQHLTGFDKVTSPAMHEYLEEFSKKLLLDFINTVGVHQWVDYAMSINDFEKELKELRNAKKKDKVVLKPDNIIDLKL